MSRRRPSTGYSSCGAWMRLSLREVTVAAFAFTLAACGRGKLPGYRSCSACDAGVCVQQIGGPAATAPPPIVCQPEPADCRAAEVCPCFDPTQGRCIASSTQPDLCICDNGIR